MNGLHLTLTQDEAVDLTMKIARHEIEREQVVKLLEDSIEPLRS